MKYICHQCHNELFEIDSDGLVLGDNGEYKVFKSGKTELPVCRECLSNAKEEENDRNGQNIRKQVITIANHSDEDLNAILKICDDEEIKEKINAFMGWIWEQLNNIDYHEGA